jgi:hypothetical protein
VLLETVTLGVTIAVEGIIFRNVWIVGLANQDWIQFFPNSLLNHFPASQSDHCPILLSFAGTYRDLPKPFHFEAFGTRNLSSFSVVANAWLDSMVGSLAFSLSRKWKKTKSALKF